MYPEKGHSSAFVEQLRKSYAKRFEADADYRNAVWRILVRDFFQRLVPPDADVLDLGCGYGQFINHITCRTKYAMDLNPSTRGHLLPQVRFLEQDCTSQWPLPDNSLDVVFSSNFFEHLMHKPAVEDAVRQVRRCLRPGGALVAMGPNIRFTGGAYWDYWDHYLPISDRSLAELLALMDFELERVTPQFLPYTMVGKRPQPAFLIATYLKLPWAWRFFGQQFLIIARRPSPSE
jgi:SAM-dependent methyltransferase